MFQIFSESKLLERLRKTAIEIVAYSEPNTPFIGLVGLVGFPFLFLVMEYVYPQHYNSIVLYLVGVLFVLPQVFFRFLPFRLKSYYPWYFFAGGFYTLPFFSFFMFLKNEGDFIWILATLGCLLFFIIIFYDWLIVSLMILAAYGLAWLLILLTDGQVWYRYFDDAYLPIFIICYFGGLFLNHRKQASQQARLSLMKSLSGSIAHEMRNPLNAIALSMENIQALLPSLPSGSDGKSREFMLKQSDLVSIHKVVLDGLDTVKSGNRMIDSILSNLREREVDQQNFRRYPIRQTIRAALDTYSYRSPDERSMIFTEIRGDFDFFGDKDQFVYVLFNLISNALYYSGKKDFRIDISADTTQVGNVIRVRDNGPGVPVAMREKIFNRFYSSGKHDGNGLGLSFCRRVVESFSGTIICDSVENRWTEFTIVLPRYESKTVQSIKKQLLATKRILVVDDQQVNRRVHAECLKAFNCQVDVAESGRQCLEMAAKCRYDMILMDIEMPGLHGDETVRLLRSGLNMTPAMLLHYRDAVIVGVTALSKEAAVRRTVQIGMNEFVAKPLTADGLAGLFDRYFFTDRVSLRIQNESLLTGCRVLVADDNAISRKFITIILENEGCIVTQAENGRQVLELLERMEFDIVLMDMEMPVMNGVEASRKIRSGEPFRRFKAFADIPIVAVTGNSGRETIESVMDSGMNACIGKPLSKQDLISTVAFWLNRLNAHSARDHHSGYHRQVSCTHSSDLSGLPGVLLDPSVIGHIVATGGSELADWFVHEFQQDGPRLVAELETAGTIDNVSMARRASHSLKGVSATIGALKLQLLAENLDDIFRAGRWPEGDDWLEHLRMVLAETSTALQSCIRHSEQVPQSCRQDETSLE